MSTNNDVSKTKFASKLSPARRSNQNAHDNDEDCDGCIGLKAMKAMSSNEQHSSSEVSNGSWKLREPATIDQVGNGSWTLLHTMAAYYPEKPDKRTVEAHNTFLHSLALVFPCKWCATDFATTLQHSPPQLESRTAFAQWLCRAHNEVNVKLGKPEFDCSLVDSRWRRETKK